MLVLLHWYHTENIFDEKPKNNSDIIFFLFFATLIELIYLNSLRFYK